MIDNKVQLKSQMVAELTDVIEEWLSDFIEKRDRVDFPYTGNNTTGLMAEAAVAVFMAVDDVQELLYSEDLMKTD